VKLFITGISGLLGLNFALQGKERFTVSGAYYNHPVALDGVETGALDITSILKVEEVFSSLQPDVIVHTAGLTNVEECEKSPALAHRLNVVGASHVATVANTLRARLVHISTDHLFDGTKPWREEADTPAPLNTYARTKWLAEKAVQEACPSALIIRTNFFGWGGSIKASFSDWILQGLEQRRALTMFSDVFFTPILINHLVDVIIEMVVRNTTGVIHVAGSERLTKYDFALQMADIFGYPTDGIHPISVDDLQLPAKRPYDMSLSSAKLGRCLQIQVPSVADGLGRLKSLKKEGWKQAMETAHLFSADLRG